jgi:predicted dehydrogenase
MLVEKPLAVDAEDARAIVRAADAAKVFLMVGFTVRYFPQYLRARQAVVSGELGTIVSAFARRVNVVTQTDRIAGRVGVLHFLGVHDFDALRWVMGDEVASVHCVSATSAPLAHNVEHETFTTLTFKKGAIACVQAGWYLPTTHPAGFDFRLDLTGRDGSLNLSMMEQGIAIHGRSGTSYPYMASPLIAEDRDFVDRVLAGAPSPITGADGLAAGAIVDAALESIATGRVIQL